MPQLLHQHSDCIWYLDQEVVTDRPVLGYVRGDRASFAVDAGASRRHVELFYRQLGLLGLPLPDFTGISHYHWDHSYGAAFVSGVTLASDLCNRQLILESSYAWTPEAMQRRYEDGLDIKMGYYAKRAEYGDLSEIRVRPAALSLSGNAAIDLGGVTVRVLYCGGPHSDDHLIFYIPEERFLFLGDASSKELFTLSWDYDETRPETIQSEISSLPFNTGKLRTFVSLLESLDFRFCMFGHADRPWNRDELLADLRSHL